MKTYEPLSQENVRLTPDFKAFVTKALGAVPFMEAGGDFGMLAKAAGACIRRTALPDRSPKKGSCL